MPIDILLYTIGCLGCSYRAIGETIPGLSAINELDSFLPIRGIFLMGFPLFATGIAADRINGHIEMRGITKNVHFCVGNPCCHLTNRNHSGQLIEFDGYIVVTFSLYVVTIGLLAFLLLHLLIILVLQSVSAFLNIKIANTALFFLIVVIA